MSTVHIHFVVFRHFKNFIRHGEIIITRKYLKVLYADDQVLTAKSEDELQVAALRLSNIAKKYNLKISTSKTKSLGMCGNEIRKLKNNDRRKNHRTSNRI
jgi:hypothetical protein